MTVERNILNEEIIYLNVTLYYSFLLKYKNQIIYLGAL